MAVLPKAHPLAATPDPPRLVELAIAWPAGETSPVVLDFVRISRRVAAQRRAG